MTRHRYYRVSPAFWADHPDWSDDARLVALYVLTCPHRTTEGLFRMPLAYAREDLGWPAKRFAKAFDQLIADGFVEYDEQASVCLIVKALKWQAPENPNQAKAAVNAIGGLPATHLLTRLQTLAQTHSPRLAEELAERLAQGFPHPPSPSLSPSQNSSGGPSNENGSEQRPPLHTLKRLPRGRAAL